MSVTMFSVDVNASVPSAKARKAVLLKNLPVLAPVVLIYAFLAFYRIDHQSFWTDEVLSLQAVAPERSFLDVWGHGQGPLYFALLHIWIKLGDSELVVRSLSTFLGLASVFLIYALGLRLVDRKFAAVSAVLLATSPFFVWYSQEARYVTLAIATSLLSMYSFHRALGTKSIGAWLFYTMATTAALFSFVPLAVIPVAQGLYLLLSTEERRKLMKWVIWQTGICIVFGFWLLMSYGRVSLSSPPNAGSVEIKADPLPLTAGMSRDLSAGVIPYTFLTFSGGFSIGPSVEELHVSREIANLLAHFPILVPMTLLYGSLFLFGLVGLWRRAEIAWWLLVWLTMPIAGLFALAATTNVTYNVRYACAAMPAYLLILAVGIAKIRRPVIQLTLLSAVLLANAFSLTQYYFNPRYAKADARAAARYLESAGDSVDAVVFIGSSTAFQYYYKGSLPIVRWGKSINSDHDSINTNVQELVRRHGRIWLVEIRPWETDPMGNVKAVLEQSLQSTDDVALPGVEISSYMPKRPISQALVLSP